MMTFMWKAFAVLVVVGVLFGLGFAAGATMKQPTPHCAAQHPAHSRGHHRS